MVFKRLKFHNLKLCLPVWYSNSYLRYLRRILGPRRDEVTGEWGKIQNVDFNELYSSPNIVGVINRE